MSLTLLGPRQTTVHGLHAIVVVLCACGHDAPIVIDGLSRQGRCGGCGTAHLIQEILYRVDLATGQTTCHYAVATLHETTLRTPTTGPIGRS